MLSMSVTTRDDLDQISSWTEKDEYHRDNNCPDWWLTGNGHLSFRLNDDQGPVVYIRIDEGSLYRLSCQFAPVDVVDKKRLIKSIVEILPILLWHVKTRGAKGLMFNSVSPKLVRFMKTLGFQPSWEHYGDYELGFEEN